MYVCIGKPISTGDQVQGRLHSHIGLRVPYDILVGAQQKNCLRMKCTKSDQICLDD